MGRHGQASDLQNYVLPNAAHVTGDQRLEARDAREDRPMAARSSGTAKGETAAQKNSFPGSGFRTPRGSTFRTPGATPKYMNSQETWDSRSSTFRTALYISPPWDTLLRWFLVAGQSSVTSKSNQSRANNVSRAAASQIRRFLAGSARKSVIGTGRLLADAELPISASTGRMFMAVARDERH